MSHPTPLDLPPVLPPPWAGGWGEDCRGVFAEVVLADRVSLELRWIPAGSFWMGSTEDEVGRWNDEGPRHEVTISRGFWLGATPVTQAQWIAVMGKNPSEFAGSPDSATCPVEQVSWDDCMEFCAAVNAMLSGLGARLPSEAEWEYACRAGTETAFNDGSACTAPEGFDPALEILGWYERNSGRETHPVGLKKVNAWGLFDMHGNVGEWCLDWWAGRYEKAKQVDPAGPTMGVLCVARGGSWFDDARLCRSAYRGSNRPGDRFWNIGFRLAAGQKLKSQIGGGVRKRAAEAGRDDPPKGQPARGFAGAEVRKHGIRA